MHWKIRLDDENGRYWLQLDRKWSDDVNDGRKYINEAEAHTEAKAALMRCSKTKDWRFKIKVISFNDGKAYAGQPGPQLLANLFSRRPARPRGRHGDE